MTSIYRQIGIGGQNLFRQIVKDELKLTDDQTKWSYKVPSSNNRMRRLELDARIDINDIADSKKQLRLRSWLLSVSRSLGVDEGIADDLRGVVF